ncbi:MULTISPECIES: pilus assembly FimT family protein [unclassified Campylobacter]|uniref:pilus assembly FimT family protein n=1 Tax=unclassified Campylobacter TaxID=2593542 RepID=UPI0022EA08AE|nr:MULTISPECIES: type II secretion system protein [unclassified Campylobacter]MDA3055859.1 type II secretion system protein [Campylobacter sp. CN_NA1]MDA3065855.1 type II secretion system protein [Campylobacter sp. CN_NE4]MDA3068715.1 type II secretion system protein [Campylobacter sp. CN_NE3]MDA3081962.1 type II secretion system protein [Campylobacter sp. CN_EL2]MDA3084300.1 type II secretion system protein [Campylobacter sp. CN_NE1]
MKTFRAFTMIELVFIIVVVGILAAVAIPKVERNGLIEAADQLSSHIRYTQQLAMNDNKFNANDDNWHRKGWRIEFDGTRYFIYSDIDASGTPQANEYAVDPMNPAKFLTSAGTGTDATNQNKKLNLANTYSITNIALESGCDGENHIMFDFKGRPMADNENLYDGLYTATCTITLTNEAGQTATIYVQPETGYVGATSTQSPNGDILYAGPGF